MKLPKNGLYMTPEDSPQFNEAFGKMLEKYFGHPLEALAVKNVTIVLTEACNFDCTYCYQHQKTKNHLTRETAEDIAEFLLDESKYQGYIDLDKHHCVVLDFIGGEPLMNVEVMDYFMDYFLKRAIELDHPWAYNYMISISSNGSLYLTDKFQKFLAKYRNRMSMGLTIDGNKELHDSCRVYYNGKGTYDDVEKAVRKWVNDFPDPSTKVTLAPENIDHLVDSITHLWNLGIFSVPANVVYEDVWKIEDATKLYYKLKELADVVIDNNYYEYKYTSLFRETTGNPQSYADNRNYCGGTGEMLAIGYDGRVYPCLRYMKYSLSSPERPEICIGSIYDGIDLPSENKHLCNLQCITRRSQSTDKCWNCQVSTGCGWCSGYNYDVFGDANIRATFQCEMHQAIALGNYYYWNKLYKKLNINKSRQVHLPKDWALEIIPEEEYEMLLQMARDNN